MSKSGKFGKVKRGSAFYSCDPPWLGHRGGITFRVDLPVATRRSDPPAVRREAALLAIAELPHPDVTIWSDGSARGGRNRAAQALIQFHHLNREEPVRAPAGAVCSSLRAELTAMREAFAAVAGLEDGELASTKLEESTVALPIADSSSATGFTGASLSKRETQDIKFLCLQGTVFDQETRVCERSEEVACTESVAFYDLNKELYQPNVKSHSEPKESSTVTDSDGEASVASVLYKVNSADSGSRSVTASTASYAEQLPAAFADVGPTRPADPHPAGYDLNRPRVVVTNGKPFVPQLSAPDPAPKKEPEEDFPSLTLPETNFTCESKVSGGHYADPETDCRMFHICVMGPDKTLERK
ncbi:hypothetical protein FJT64_004128 [Amphibalanus amphitrite]|uniref:Uncharacterized protein n=1 Tax=Amphibalanus amphitrite TaxID=1232801 RepID=A0A6A4W8X9_AMPAM|nr:hypothetical protein FJT64_004128 [Amphibalanus amphitrite]